MAQPIAMRALRKGTVSGFFNKYKNTTISVLSGILIFLFIYASASKLLDFKRFIDELNNQPLPNSWTPYLSWAIPITEILISIALVNSRTRKSGFWGSLVLMMTFSIYSTAVLLNFFDRIPCSCGGVIRQLTWSQHLLFSIFFVLVSVCGLVLPKKSHQLYKLPKR